MPADHKKRVIKSVQKAFGVDESQQEDAGPSFLQQVIDALKGSKSLSERINSSIKKRNPSGSK